MTDREKIAAWVRVERDSYARECGDEALAYMVMDANGDCGTSLPFHEIEQIVRAGLAQLEQCDTECGGHGYGEDEENEDESTDWRDNDPSHADIFDSMYWGIDE